MTMEHYAYKIPDRPESFPNLYIASQAPWRGLTAIIQGKPYLVIDKNSKTYSLEGEDGDILYLERFLWSGEVTKADKLVAASRMPGSPLKVGNLFFDDFEGWLVYKEDRRFNVQAAIDHLEAFNWFKVALKQARLSGSFIHEMTGEPIDFYEVDHYGADKSTGMDEYWTVNGDDGREYIIGNGVVTDELSNIVGHFDPYADPDEYEYDDSWYDDWEGPTSKVAEGEGYSFRGNTAEIKGIAEGVAVRPDKQSKDEIMATVDELPGHEQDVQKQKELIPDWALNRGGKVAAPFQPGQGAPGMGGQPVTYAPGVIVVSKWVQPDDNYILLHDKCVGIVAEAGGLSSHGVVVARERNIPIIVDAAEAAQIQPGDRIRMNGDTGIIDVNGGGEVEDRTGPGQQASMGETRFVWSKGDHEVAEVPADNPESGKLHQEMMMEMDQQGRFDWGDFAFGTVYSDGHVDLLGMASDTDDLKQWLMDEFNVTDIKEVGDMSAVGKTSDVDDTMDVQYKEKYKALVCPRCGSHTIRAFDVEKGQASMKCLTCGKEFKRPVYKNPEARVAAEGKYSPGTRIQMSHQSYKNERGTILECNGKHKDLDEENYKILLDSGNEIDEIPESAFKKIKSATFNAEEFDTTDEYFLDSMALTHEAEWSYPDNKGGMLPGAVYPEHEQGQGQIEELMRQIAEANKRGDRLTVERLQQEMESLMGGNPHQQLMRQGVEVESTFPYDNEPTGLKRDPLYHYNDYYENAIGVMVEKERMYYETLMEQTDEEDARYWAGRMQEITGESADSYLNRWRQHQSQARSNFQKGSPYPENSYKNSPDHTPKGQKDWPEEVNAIYNACMREGNGRGDTKDEKQSSCAAIAWAQYKKNKGKPKDSDKNSHEAKVAADSNGNPLQPGQIYAMYSTRYKVPDVVQILNVHDDSIEAAIEGDNKGSFPLKITAEDIENNGYSFEPWEEHDEPKTAGWKLARRNFTPGQQRELINENPYGRARNFDRLDLDGTHYPRQDDDPIDQFFLW